MATYTENPRKNVPAILMFWKNRPNGTSTVSLKSVKELAKNEFNHGKSITINPLQKLMYSKCEGYNIRQQDFNAMI